MKRRLTGEKAINGLILLSPGGLAAVGAALIGARLLPFVPEDLSTWVLLYLPWQTFGLTLAKVGVDQLTFALVSKNPESRIDLKPVSVWRILPLAIIFGCVTYGVYDSAYVAAITAITIFLDGIAVTVAAELNARGRYRRVAFAHLFNHPLFFLATISACAIGYTTVRVVISVFLIASVARLTLLIGPLINSKKFKKIKFRGQMLLVVQQTVNFLLYKIDQITIGLIGSIVGLASGVQAITGEFVFFARFPEIITAIFMALGPLYLPPAYSFLRLGEVTSPRKNLLRVISIVVFCVSLAGCAYIILWNGDETLSVIKMLPFILHAILVFPANVATYISMRDEQLMKLVVNLIGSVLVGVVWVVFAVQSRGLQLIYWAVPVQLSVFLFLQALLLRNNSRE